MAGVSWAPRAAWIPDAAEAILRYVWSQHRISPLPNCLKTGGRVPLKLMLFFGAVGLIITGVETPTILQM